MTLQWFSKEAAFGRGRAKAAPRLSAWGGLLKHRCLSLYATASSQYLSSSVSIASASSSVGSYWIASVSDSEVSGVASSVVGSTSGIGSSSGEF